MNALMLRRRCIVGKKKVDYSKCLRLTALQTSTFSVIGCQANSSTVSTVATLYYSTDGGTTWSSLTPSTETQTVATVSAGNYVLLKGIWNTEAVDAQWPGLRIQATGNFNASGNIMSLLFNDDFENQYDLTNYQNAFSQLFYYNTYLKSARDLELPALYLGDSTYSNMFLYCTSLTTGPRLLPAVIGNTNSYFHMFFNCYNMTTGPQTFGMLIPGQSACEGMFQQCKALTNIFPTLPARTLASRCYFNMFHTCQALTTPPALPAVNLAPQCYQAMFLGCINLTTAPDLPAKNLINGCYNSMFQDCSKLNYVRAMFGRNKYTINSSNQPNCTTNWLSGVASTGTIVRSNLANWTNTGVNGVPSGWTVQTETMNISNKYLTFETIQDCTFQFSQEGLYYSTNGTSWTTLAANTATPTIAAGNRIYFKGEISPVYATGSGTFSSTGQFNVLGNPKSLFFGDSAYGQPRINAYAYKQLFQNCTNLINAQELIIDANAGSSCYKMFDSCTNLVTTPQLVGPVDSSCYLFTFQNCTSLQTAVLPEYQMTSNGYQYTFYGCPNLNYIKILLLKLYVTSSSIRPSKTWVYNCAATGTIARHIYARWENDIVPTGWNIQKVNE